MNYPYEMLVKNWNGSHFAGGRLALTEGRLFVQSAQQLLIECWLCKIWDRLVYESVLVGAVLDSAAALRGLRLVASIATHGRRQPGRLL
jgi:hypothetical protein